MVERKIQSAVVTGPTGAIGVALCEALLAAGVTVYAVLRPGSPRAAALPEHAALHKIPCDAAALDKLPELLHNGGVAQADAFYHFAWAHTTGAGRNDMPVQVENIRHSVAAVRAAAALGCRVFIGAGSQAEYGRVEGVLQPDTPARPENGYGMAKLCAGQMTRVEAKRLGLAHVWARVLSVYGPHEGPNSMVCATIRTLLAGQCPALTAGEQRWDYLYAADAADAFLRMACHGVDGAVYPLGSGRAQPLRDYVSAIRDAIDPALPLGFGQLPYAPGQVMHLQADLTALQRDCAFAPQTDFAAGIRETIRWVKE